ncbi:hypothetical protein EDD22DRAFT_850242 [Suillus occidentalis]|nr:hypothetical protein EDD22DRAFT_850242 [Suillus occidentalis]
MLIWGMLLELEKTMGFQGQKNQIFQIILCNVSSAIATMCEGSLLSPKKDKPKPKEHRQGLVSPSQGILGRVRYCSKAVNLVAVWETSKGEAKVVAKYARGGM